MGFRTDPVPPNTRLQSNNPDNSIQEEIYARVYRLRGATRLLSKKNVRPTTAPNSRRRRLRRKYVFLPESVFRPRMSILHTNRRMVF